MSVTNKIAYLLACLAAIVILPWAGSAIHYHGLFPAGFFAYPPLTALPKAGFNIYVFAVIALACLVVCCVYLFPSWFGFKKVVETGLIPPPKVKLPFWFWLGLVSWGTVIVLLATKDSKPVHFIHWSDFPLFWGFTLMLDGWVYVRNGGRSLISKVPQEVVGIGVASISGWMIFEFLNFFVDDNWYYPKGNIIDREEFLLYACVISSGLLPLALEWYCVFKTFPKFSVRFSNGWKIKVSRTFETVVMVMAMVGLFASGLFPDALFFSLWLSPPIILTIALHKIGVWTPVMAIRDGNWSPVLLSALTYFVTGFMLEGQNYLSAIHTVPVWTEDPAYWQYSLPYVNVLHIFEMPLLGFWGYLPFGIYCWLWWIAIATLLNIPARFLSENPLKFETSGS